MPELEELQAENTQLKEQIVTLQQFLKRKQRDIDRGNADKKAAEDYLNEVKLRITDGKAPIDKEAHQLMIEQMRTR